MELSITFMAEFNIALFFTVLQNYKKMHVRVAVYKMFVDIQYGVFKTNIYYLPLFFKTIVFSAAGHRMLNMGLLQSLPKEPFGNRLQPAPNRDLWQTTSLVAVLFCLSYSYQFHRHHRTFQTRLFTFVISLTLHTTCRSYNPRQNSSLVSVYLGKSLTNPC